MKHVARCLATALALVLLMVGCTNADGGSVEVPEGLLSEETRRWGRDPRLRGLRRLRVQCGLWAGHLGSVRAGRW